MDWRPAYDNSKSEEIEHERLWQCTDCEATRQEKTAVVKSEERNLKKT